MSASGSETATKDQALYGIFKALRVSFKNATMYHMEHPAFVHCIEDLKSRLEAIFAILGPLSIGFTPRGLFADNRFWEGDKLFRELGRQFHFRKIKSLEFRPGVSLEELMRFSTKVTMPLKDFVKQGGGAEVLKKENILHIAVEELDYSELLRGEGEEIKDIWPYLLQEAVEENDREKIARVAESFHRVIDKIDTTELVVDEELSRNFAKFFSYLKENEATEYRSCARNLIKSFIANKNINLQSKFDNLRPLITDLKEEDLASTLWEEIISNDKFDSLSFSIFSKILESDRHCRISASLRDLFHSENPLNRRPEAEEKIKALLSGTSGQFISEIYRQTLSGLLNEIRFEKKITFDHDLLGINYRYILLNTLEHEVEGQKLTAVVDRILAMWGEIAGRRDFEYLTCLQDILLAKRAAFSEWPAFRKAEDALGECVENAVLGGEASPFFSRLISGLPESRLGLEAYLDRIFSQGRLSPFILRAYYRFFNEQMDRFTSALKSKRRDRPFLDSLMGAVTTIDSPLSLTILKAVYAVGDEPVRREALRAMDGLTLIDKGFLFPLLSSRKTGLKTEAFILLVRRDATRKRALDRFLRFESPYGIRNKVLKAHIRIVEEQRISEARDHLLRLSRRKSFWNRGVRQEALRVLESWHEC